MIHPGVQDDIPRPHACRLEQPVKAVAATVRKGRFENRAGGHVDPPDILQIRGQEPAKGRVLALDLQKLFFFHHWKTREVRHRCDSCRIESGSRKSRFQARSFFGRSGIGLSYIFVDIIRHFHASSSNRALKRAVLTEVRRALLAVRQHTFLDVLAHEAKHLQRGRRIKDRPGLTQPVVQ